MTDVVQVPETGALREAGIVHEERWHEIRQLAVPAVADAPVSPFAVFSALVGPAGGQATPERLDQLVDECVA